MRRNGDRKRKQTRDNRQRDLWEFIQEHGEMKEMHASIFSSSYIFLPLLTDLLHFCPRHLFPPVHSSSSLLSFLFFIWDRCKQKSLEAQELWGFPPKGLECKRVETTFRSKEHKGDQTLITRATLKDNTFGKGSVSWLWVNWNIFKYR